MNGFACRFVNSHRGGCANGVAPVVADASGVGAKPSRRAQDVATTSAARRIDPRTDLDFVVVSFIDHMIPLSRI
jgi:hypothetical protein